MTENKGPDKAGAAAPAKSAGGDKLVTPENTDEIAVTPGLAAPERPAPAVPAEGDEVEAVVIESPERDELERQTRTVDVIAVPSLLADGTPDQTDGFRRLTEVDGAGRSTVVPAA